MTLTDMKIRAIRPEARIKKYSDGGGLHLAVKPNGLKQWLKAYRFGGKQKTLSFGIYPMVSLADARVKRDEAKRLLANGVDPGLAVKRAKLKLRGDSQNTFDTVSRELMIKFEKEGMSAITLKKKRWLLDMASKAFGTIPVKDLTAADVLGPLREVEAKGNYETAQRLRSTIGQVFRYAIATARCDYDPTYGLRGALISPKAAHRAALVEKPAFKRLVRDVWSYQGAPSTAVGLKLMAILYPRPGELRFSKWEEFDLDRGVWTIPAARTKMRREHRKPLPAVAIDVIESHKENSLGEWVLASYTNPTKPISENTLNQAIRRMGYTKAEATAHGFRASASSLLNESGLFSPDAIEAELAHLGQNQVRRAYHRSVHWDERLKMSEWWSAFIEGCLS
ncbi:MAG: integrase arm-type DNA-binding domain-containing protein [Pseudomonadota bacterium]